MTDFVKKKGSLASRIAIAIDKTKETYDNLAKNLGVSRNTIMTYKKSKGDIKGIVIENLVKFYNFNPTWLLIGELPIYKDIEPDNNQEGSDTKSSLTKIIIEHQGIIKHFKNPEKAKEFNEFLIKIEDEDPEGYDELYKEAKAIAKTIKRLKDQEKKVSGNQKNGTNNI